MKKVYISLPMTGREDTIWERFNEAVAYVRNMPGYEDCELMIPVGIKEFEDPDRPNRENPHTWGWYMGRDLEMLADSGCTDIFFGLGWQESKGCRLEFEASKILEIPRIFWRHQDGLKEHQ